MHVGRTGEKDPCSIPSVLPPPGECEPMFHSETQNENEASISRTQISAFAPRSFQCKQTMLLMMPTLKAEEEI